MTVIVFRNPDGSEQRFYRHDMSPVGTDETLPENAPEVKEGE